MPFVPNSFTDGSAGGTPITAATLNNLEQGVVAADITTPGSAAVLALDGLVAGYVGAASATKTALGVSYVAPVAYVPAPTGVFATDTANILAAANKLPVGGSNPGGTVVLRAGQYNAALPSSIPYITYRGQGRAATEVRCSSGSMMAPTTSLINMGFEDLTLSTTGLHLFDFGTTGGMNLSRFSYVTLVTYVDTASLLKQNGSGPFIEVLFEACDFNRQSTSTVSAIDMRNSAGGLNSNLWLGCRFQSNLCASTPFVRIEGTLGAYAHDNTFKKIVGERNVGGLIHAYSVNGLTIQDCAEWDAATTYLDHLINIQTSATSGGAVSRGVSISNTGTRFGTMASGKNHVNVGAVATAISLDRIGDPNGTSKLSYIQGQSSLDAWGASGTIGFPTTNYTVDRNLDGTVIANGASITVTLPAPTTIPILGRKFTVKNLNSTALTVNATGGALIDGAASRSLAQFVSITVTTDGAAWFVV